MTDLDKYRKEAEAVKERAEKASRPPWPAEIWHGNDGGFAAIGPVHKSEDENEFETPEDENGLAAQADADFIAHARHDAPTQADRVLDLCAEVERLRTDIDEMSAQLAAKSRFIQGIHE